MVWVKICGLRSVEQAIGCVDAGADAIGLNFWAGTPRHVEIDIARAIVEAVGSNAQTVGVFVDADVDEIKKTVELTGVQWVQLHGQESPALLATFLPNAYKAIGVGMGEALQTSRLYGGEHVMLDAAVAGQMPGGTGHTFDWSVAEVIAKERKLTLAGGLTPDNVADAIRQVRPYRVDVASGVEQSSGDKDLDKVARFIRAAKKEGSDDARVG